MSDKKEHKAPEHMHEDKIDGVKLLEMLKSVLPALVNHIDSHDHDDEESNEKAAIPFMPFAELAKDDFVKDDPMVNKFDKDMGGCDGMVKIIRLNPVMAAEKIATTIDNMNQIKTASKLINIRKAFETVKDFSFENSGAKQLRALEYLDKLQQLSESDSERYAYTKAKRAVLSGNVEQIDAAAYRLQSVFASEVKHPNVRVAFYENPRQQDEEPYQLCPKARHQIGHAVPMPVSSCRDNCIDSRVTKDGKVSCAYQDWLERAADNHINVINRLDEVHPEDNAKNRLNLKDGERFNPASLAIDTMTFEQRMADKLKKIKDSKKSKQIDKNIEAKLDDKSVLTGHQGLVGEGNMEDRLRKPVIASKAGIDPDEEISFGAQLEAKRQKLYVEEPIQTRLDEVAEPNLGRHGEPTDEDRSQNMNIKKAWNLSKNTSVSPESDDNLGVQITTRHETDEDNDSTLEELLADAEHYYDDDEMEALVSTLEELLGKSHKGY
jgi:hypothetical protein